MRKGVEREWAAREPRGAPRAIPQVAVEETCAATRGLWKRCKLLLGNRICHLTLNTKRGAVVGFRDSISFLSQYPIKHPAPADVFVTGCATVLQDRFAFAPGVL